MTDPFSSDGRKAPPKPFTATEGARKIRSFVLRQGRFTDAQQRAFDELWPRFGPKPRKTICGTKSIIPFRTVTKSLTAR